MIDPVNNPPHYTSGQVEVIDLLEQAVAHAPMPVHAALQWQALKYLNRMWLKGKSLEDAKKSRWYIERLISKLEEQ